MAYSGVKSDQLMLLFLAFGMAFGNPLSVKWPNRYGIVIDCGSTHSKLIVYTWIGKELPGTSDAVQKYDCNSKDKGIANYGLNPDKAGESLAECLQSAKDKFIEPERQKNAPIFVGATAGMRLLERNHPSQSRAILDSITKTVKSFPFLYKFVKIISGGEEGAYGWVTVNFLLGKLAKNDQDRKSIRTVGAMDLGGASTQITFETQPRNLTMPANYTQLLHLYDQTYNIFSYSFLCYGINYAHLQYRAILVKRSKASINSSNGTSNHVVNDPCGNKGSKFIHKGSEIFEPPCVRPTEDLVNRNYEFVGTGEIEECKNIVRELFNKTGCEYNTSCSFNQAFLPQLTGEFMAFSAFYKNFQFFNGTDSTTLPELKGTIDVFCALSWTEVQENNKNPKIAKFLKDYCFNGNYIVALLTYGYGFNEQTWNHIHFVDKINGSNVNWAMGLMLNETGQLPPLLLKK